MAADGRIQIDVDLNDKDAQKGLKGIESEASGIGTKGSKSIGGFTSKLATIGKVAAVGVAGVAGVGAAVGALAAPLVKAAASVLALNSQFSQVFGSLESEATKSLNGIAESTSILPERLKGTFTQIAAFTRTTGADAEQSLGIASRATLAAADSAAFYDRSIEEVTENLQSFLKGKVVAPL